MLRDMRNESFSHSFYINRDKKLSSEDEGIEIKEYFGVFFSSGRHVFIVVVATSHANPRCGKTRKTPPHVQCQYLLSKRVSNFKCEHLALSHNSKTTSSKRANFFFFANYNIFPPSKFWCFHHSFLRRWSKM